MNFKLDENLGNRFKKLFIMRGFNAETVYIEELHGITDHNIIVREKKCLNGLELDFSDVKRFPPNNTEGIVILRLHKRSAYELAAILIDQFLDTIKNYKINEGLSGNL